MFRKSLLLLLISVLLINKISFSQTKAIVVYNNWSNDLDNYNPKSFFEGVFGSFKNKLAVKEFSGDPTKLDVTRSANDWDKKFQSDLVAKQGDPDSIYYVALSCQLKLPAINLGKFLFKNPMRSSKMTFTYHVFNGAGIEVVGDTIINRGCLIKNVDETKGNKFFYSDFNSFKEDLECHLEVIKKQIQEKQLRINRKNFREI